MNEINIEIYRDDIILDLDEGVFEIIHNPMGEYNNIIPARIKLFLTGGELGYVITSSLIGFDKTDIIRLKPLI